MNPVEEYLQLREEGISKTAIAVPGAVADDAAKGFGHAFTGFKKGIKGLFTEEGGKHMGMDMGAHLLTGIGGTAVGVAATKAYRAATKSRDYEKMMAHNPDLKEYRRENTPLFMQHYTSLRGMAPEFAADPIVGGTYMRQMSVSPESAGKVIMEALGARKGLAPPATPFSTKPRDAFRYDPHGLASTQAQKARLDVRRARIQDPLQAQKMQLDLDRADVVDPLQVDKLKREAADAPLKREQLELQVQSARDSARNSARDRLKNPSQGR